MDPGRCIVEPNMASLRLLRNPVLSALEPRRFLKSRTHRIQVGLW